MNDDSIQALIKDAIGPNLATHYIVVVEVMTEEGMDLRIATSDNMTAWHAAGMLDVAKEMVIDSRYVTDEESDEE
jgi:hypothetical protein